MRGRARRLLRRRACAVAVSVVASVPVHHVCLLLVRDIVSCSQRPVQVPLRESVCGRGPSCIGHRSSCAVRVGTGEAGASPVREGRARSPKGSGGEPLAGGAGRQRQQAEEDRPSVGKGGKLGHVADALGKGDGGGPASKQARKPLGGLKARVVGVEGEEDPGAAPQASATLSTPCVPRAATAGTPQVARAASRRHPRRRPPRAARGRDAQAQPPAWGRGAPGNGVPGRGLQPARQATGQARLRCPGRPPSRRTAQNPAR